MNKNELELQKLVIRSENLREVFSLIKHALSLATIAGCIYIAFDCIRDMVTARPDTLHALAGVIEKMNLGFIFSCVVTIVSACGWAYERRGKKRAIRKLRDFRGKVESEDDFNQGSGLDVAGHTPA